MKKIIETQRAPGAIGPYVQGVDLGSMVFTSGQIPVCPQTGEIPADVQDQARMILPPSMKSISSSSMSIRRPTRPGAVCRLRVCRKM